MSRETITREVLLDALARDLCGADSAREMGVSKAAVYYAQRRHGVRLPNKSRERAAERMRRLNQDPEFAKANAERAAERMRRLNQDPEFNPLAALTEAERADYDTLKRAGYSRREALAAVGRGDLIGG